MIPLLRWHGDPPPLRRPILLVALDGFVDAGAAASTAAMFLRHRWRSEVFATFERDEVIDYRARRPTVVVDSGQVRRIEWPDIEVLSATVDGPHDVVFLLGPEPDMRWGAFCSDVAVLCERLGVEAVLTIGAYPAPVPHTRPTRIMKGSNGVGGDLVPEALPVPGYTGPVGAATALQSTLADHDIPAVGLWAEVPHYVAASPNPTCALALVQLVAATLGTEVDTTELEAAAVLHLEQVDEAVAEHPEASGMVTALEQYIDADEEVEPLPSGEDIAAEIERYLRTQSE